MRAWGLRPRGARTHLALAMRPMWPSDTLERVGAPEVNEVSRLHTLPTYPSVNASPMPSRAPAHDSGPVWLARPSPYDSFIRYSSPATGAFRGISWRREQTLARERQWPPRAAPVAAGRCAPPAPQRDPSTSLAARRAPLGMTFGPRSKAPGAGSRVALDLWAKLRPKRKGVTPTHENAAGNISAKWKETPEKSAKKTILCWVRSEKCA